MSWNNRQLDDQGKLFGLCLIVATIAYTILYVSPDQRIFFAFFGGIGLLLGWYALFRKP